MKKNPLTILLYHGVTNKDQKGIVNFSGKHINIKIFDNHMKFIKNNCNILSMNEVVEIYIEDDVLSWRVDFNTTLYFQKN